MTEHKRRCITDRAPTERYSGVMVWVVEILALCGLGALLALAFVASGARADTLGMTLQATVQATVHDPLRGTTRYDQALTRIQYAGTGPYVITLTGRDAASHITATLAGPADSMRYQCTGSACALTGTMTVYVPGRLFAAGFEQ